jgi:hypothetical protein
MYVCVYVCTVGGGVQLGPLSTVATNRLTVPMYVQGGSNMIGTDFF